MMEPNIRESERIFPAGSWYNLITTDDRFLPDVVTSYFISGIHNDEKCMLYNKSVDTEMLCGCFSDNGVDLESVIKSGQLEIADIERCGQSIDLVQLYDQSIQSGYSGLRIAADYSYNKLLANMSVEQKNTVYKNCISYISLCNADKIGVSCLLDIVEDNSNFILIYDGKFYVHNENIGFEYNNGAEMARQVLMQILIDRQKLKRENDILEILNNTAGEAVYSGNPGHILDVMLSKIMDICMADMGFLSVRKNTIIKSQDDITAIQNIPAEVLSSTSENMSKDIYNIIDKVVKSGQCLSTEDNCEITSNIKYFMDMHSIVCGIIIPVKLQEKVVGYLLMASKRQGYSFKYKIPFLKDSMNIMAAILYNQNQLYEVYNEAYEAQKMKALGVLTSGIAHEFNNLLTPILGFAQIIKQRVESPDLKMYVDMIENSARDGAMIVKRVQEFTRREDKKSRAEFDLNKIIMEIIKMTKPRWKNEAEANGKKITIKGEPNSCKYVIINPSEIREVLTNILFNAVDAIQNEGVIIIRTWDEEEKVFFSVQDNGIGMSEEILDNIYTPFFTTKKERGTGLGLSIVYNILHDHGGAVSVQSELGKGTTVTMWLPATAMESEQGQSTDSSYRRFSGRVLVVDGHDTAGRTASSMLAEFGFDADIAKNGEQALSLFDKNKYRFVLCDLAMSDMTGAELAKKFKSIDSNVQVVLMNGWISDINEEDRNTVDSVLRKPFSMGTMYTAVNEALGNCVN